MFNSSYSSRMLQATIIALSIAIIVVGGYRILVMLNSLSISLSALEKNIDKQQARLDSFSSQLQSVQQSYNEIQKVFVSLRKQQHQTQETVSQTQKEFSTTVSTIQSELQTKISQETLTSLIGDWYHRVGKIKCHNTDNKSNASNGSAVAMKNNSTIRFVTNTHVVKKNDAVLDECIIHFPESDKTFRVKKSDMTHMKDVDITYLDTQNKPTEEIAVALEMSICSHDPAVGEQLVILGYPRTGAENGITATEGIISGFEKPYYITSAKIEQGNSGGGAVSVSENCFLGMPTLAIAGRLESMARILPAPTIHEKNVK